jgi:hypothetical protein
VPREDDGIFLCPAQAGAHKQRENRGLGGGGRAALGRDRCPLLAGAPALPLTTTRFLPYKGGRFMLNRKSGYPADPAVGRPPAPGGGRVRPWSERDAGPLRLRVGQSRQRATSAWTAAEPGRAVC